MRCLICKAEFEHPYRAGRKSKVCGPRCRAEHKRQWHKLYDAQDRIKKAKMLRYYRKKAESQP